MLKSFETAQYEETCGFSGRDFSRLSTVQKGERGRKRRMRLTAKPRKAKMWMTVQQELSSDPRIAQRQLIGSPGVCLFYSRKRSKCSLSCVASYMLVS